VTAFLDDGTLSAGEANSLISKLQNALRLLEAAKDIPAINQINSFIKQVEALTGKALEPEQSQELTDAANEIIDTILAGD